MGDAASVLVLGASGQVGSRLTARLARSGVVVRAFHDPAAGPNHALPAGIEQVIGDFGDDTALRSAAAGIDAVFMLTPPSASQVRWQHAIVAAARDAKVARVVKLAAFETGDGTALQMGRWHRDGELALIRSGMPWVLLRPQYFMQNTVPAMRGALEIGHWRGTASIDVALGIVDADDVAAVAAAALIRGGHDGEILVPTGPEPLTFAEMAARLSTSVGREIRYEQRPQDEVRRELVERGWPGWHIDDYFLIHGEAASPLVTTCVAEVTGAAPRSFADFLKTAGLAVS
jgi:uncharacterized protein YbjT (DUF2867 family)